MTAGRQPNSENKDWCTPPDIVHSVRDAFGGVIDLDPCSNSLSVVGAVVEYVLPEHDGLEEPWNFKHIFVNPPYGSDRNRGTRIKNWFVKVAHAADLGSEVIVLVPVATNTSHWKEYVFPKASAICFLYTPRVKFIIGGVRDTKGAPMSCCVIYYGQHFDRFAESFRSHGAVLPLNGAVLPLNGAVLPQDQQQLLFIDDSSS